MSLDEIKAEANIMEAVERQLSDFGTKSENQNVNKIRIVGKKGEINRCSRCGSKDQ